MPIPEVIKSIQPMMHGPAVRRLQELCDLLGFDNGMNDGIFGPASENALRLAQIKLDVKPDGICGPVTWGAFAKLGNAPTEVFGVYDPAQETDLRLKHANPRLFGGFRKWDQIDSIVLHQTGCNMPNDPLGWQRLNAHVGVLTSGTFVIVNDPTFMIWHAQTLSKRSIGIEIEGNFKGIEDNERTLWKGGGPAAMLESSQIEGANKAIQWVVNQFEQNGQTCKHIFAHRQSKNTRAFDPGEAIWKGIALPWIEKLGCDYDPKYSIGSGYRIPMTWDPDSPVIRFWS